MRRCQLVLVVDDDPAICRTLESRLRGADVDVVSVMSGAEAEQLIDARGDEIDLILLDVGLPDTDGFTLCRALRDRPETAETPIIFLTGRDSPEDTIQGFDAGGTDYVVKPFHHAVLHARVNAALRAQRLFHERCEAEATLRESEARYRYLSAHCFDMISRHNRDGTYIDVSPACQQLLFYEPDDLIGRSAYDFIHPDDLSAVADNHQSLLRGEASKPVIFRGRRKDGEYIWLESVCRVLPDTDGEINCVTRDVTSRKRAEDAIRASEAKLQAITAQLPAVIWTADQWMAIHSMYGALLADFDLDGPAMVGRSLRDFATFVAGEDEQSIIDAHQRAMRGESVRSQFTCDDREFEMRVEPMLNHAGECIGCLGVAFDVTERRRIEEVERSRAALEDAVAAMEQVLGVIGHELRTPLTGLRVMSEYLLSETKTNGEAPQFLSMIHDEVIRMASMVNDLLEAARINSGRAKWNWTEFDLTGVCHNVLDIVRHSTDNSNVTFGCEVWPCGGEADQPLMMRGDRDAIHRLLVNLLTNAAKHTREGVVMAKAIETQRDGQQWIDVEIRDTGEGIPQHVLEKIGVPFALNAGVVQDTKPGDPANGHGCGLGLAICKGIAIAHGGRMQFESQVGMGTTVHVSLRGDLTGPSQNQEYAIFASEVSR